MSKLTIIGVGAIVAFFLAFMIFRLNIPVIGDIVKPVAQSGILLPLGLGLLFMGSPKIMFIVIIGGLLFVIQSGVPLIGF